MTTTGEKMLILDQFFAAIPKGQIETVKATYHPDCVIWHSNDNATQTVAENLPVLGWVAKNIKGIRYEEIVRTPMDTGQVIQQHVLRGVGPSGKELNIVACIVFTFTDDGRIIRLEEYLDSAQVAVLRA